MTMREVLKHIIFFGFCMVAVSAIASEARATPAWLTNQEHGVLIASKTSVSVTPNHVSNSDPSGVAIGLVPVVRPQPPRQVSDDPVTPPRQGNEVAIGLVPIVRPPRKLSDDPVTPPRQGSVDPVTPPRQGNEVAIGLVPIVRPPRKLSDDPVTPPRQGSVDPATPSRQGNEVAIDLVPIVRPHPPRQLSDDPVTPPRQGSVDPVTPPRQVSEIAWRSPPKKVVNCSPIMINEGVIASVPIVRPRPPPPPRQVSANHVTLPKSTHGIA